MAFKKLDPIPEFLIIGAGKSGTTSLDNYLKQHPSIFIPTVKEPNFYGYENSSVEDFKDEPDELLHYQGSVTNLEDYLALFKNAKPNQIKGETSNTYLYHPTAPERIKHYNPNMKLIAIFREPSKRLYSRYLHLARENSHPPIESVYDRTSIWWKRNDLIKEGFYYSNLAPYYSLFPHENILPLLYDDFNQNPQQMMAEIFTFLGVSSDFSPNMEARFNQSGFVKNKTLDWLYGEHSPVFTGIKKILPTKKIEQIKGSHFFQKTINSLRGKNLAKPKMDAKLKQWLVNDVYKADVLKLQELLNRDLSQWLK